MPARTTLKFISTTTDAGSPRGKRARHACETCRKRKKRCLHDSHEALHDDSLPSKEFCSDSLTTETSVQESNIEAPRRAKSSRDFRLPSSSTNDGVNHVLQETARSSPSVSSPDDDEIHTARHKAGREPNFICHLNPEGFFLASTSLGASEAAKQCNSIGLWLSRETRNSLYDGLEPHCTAIDGSNRHTRGGTSRAILSSIASTEVLPTPLCFKTSRSIYLRDIYPIFPILPPETLPIQLKSDPSVADTVLAQALSIAVATNMSARPHLCLQRVDGVLEPKEFAGRLSRAILRTIDHFKIRDHLLLARVFAILSIFSSFTTDLHTAAEYGYRAIGNIHTIQVHLDTSNVRTDHVVVTQTFLCVWAIDRLNAILHSRPCIMHTRDIGRDIGASIAEQHGCFRALLVMCDRLDGIIDLYRPFHQSGEHDRSPNIPGFDDLIVEVNAVQSPIHLLATIETLYHSIAMLSHRFHSVEDPDRSSISYLRSSLSTAKLIGLVESNLPHPLSNFPFVPYSLSLALRVCYRELRLSKTPLYRSRARSDVLHVCELLGTFGKNYPFAESLSRLATKIIREMDKVATSVIQARQTVYDQSKGPVSLESEQNTRSSAVAHVPEDTLAEQQDHAALAHHQNFYDTSDARTMPEYCDAQNDAEVFANVFNLPDLPDIFDHFDSDFNFQPADLALGQTLGLESFDNTDIGAQLL